MTLADTVHLHVQPPIPRALWNDLSVEGVDLAGQRMKIFNVVASF